MELACKNCGGRGRLSVGYNVKVSCECCEGTGFVKPSLSVRFVTALGIVMAMLVAITFIFAMMYVQNALATESAYVSDVCEPVWVVKVGDTADDIVRQCFPNKHLGMVKEQLRELNPHIGSLGMIRPGQQIVLWAVSEQ